MTTLYPSGRVGTPESKAMSEQSGSKRMGPATIAMIVAVVMWGLNIARRYSASRRGFPLRNGARVHDRVFGCPGRRPAFGNEHKATDHWSQVSLWSWFITRAVLI